MLKLINYRHHISCIKTVRSFLSSNKFAGWFEREAQDERNRLQLATFLDILYDHQTEELDHLSHKDQKDTASQKIDAYLSAPSSSSSHHTHHNLFSDKLQPSNLISYLDACLHQNDLIINDSIFHESIVHCEELMHNHNNISVVPSHIESCVIVGDLHGDLSSLAHIYKKLGPPSDKLVYIFNGDVIDRGYQSVECLYFILGLLQYYGPHYIFYNRGNHEDVFINKAYGFMDELVRKYGYGKAQLLKEALSRFYTSLPLCTWIPKYKTFIAHAGPPLYSSTKDSTSTTSLFSSSHSNTNNQHVNGNDNSSSSGGSLSTSESSSSSSTLVGASTNEIMAINRRSHKRTVALPIPTTPITNTPSTSTTASATKETATIDKDNNKINNTTSSAVIKQYEKSLLLENLLWSDPDMSVIGVMKNQTRGAGLQYGKC